MTFAVGTLVRARGREWVVLPESDETMLVLQPLGGTSDEIAGVLPDLEHVESATFPPPTVADLGDARSARLLRDALRLGFRASAGPFRSFGQINVEPRPYQLVPLMMSLRLDPVRLLIADDVGTGKTVSTLLVAAEMLAQGKVKRLSVLCPPHLATQWQDEMRSRFHLDAAIVLSSTASRLERGCQVGETLFDRHDITIVSTEFIKSDRRRSEFLRTAPELVIVDEAHTCAFDGATKGGRQLRHELLTGLASNPDRHILLVTATPHSGNEQAFRSLITLLDDDFADLPEDLSGEKNRRHRERLAMHMVQRRRGDLRQYLEIDTPFPERDETEVSYQLTKEGRALFDAAIDYAREVVRDSSTDRRRQRMQWWSIVALLRSLASSPAAAIDTLTKRSLTSDAADASEADRIGRQHALDLGDEEGEEYDDETGGGVIEDAGQQLTKSSKLGNLRKLAEAMSGKHDAKLQGLVDIVKQLIDEGRNPIVFCRYIPTVEYYANELAARFPNIEVRGVSGKVPSSERAEIVAELGEHPRRILVASDCLSEGINLQHTFDAVVHADLAWTPTRHEQREGRVDRLGQPSDRVKVVTYYGRDNGIDGLVLDVLLRRHAQIRTSLGYSVPIPGDANAVAEAIIEGALLREGRGAQLTLEGMEPAAQLVLDNWTSAADREKRSRTVFAQNTIQPAEVARELAAMQAALGATADVRRFVTDALQSSGAHITGSEPVTIELSNTPIALRDAMNLGEKTVVKARFNPPASEDELLLSRTHPTVSGLAAYVLDNALDPLREGPATRAGVMRTKTVTALTTVLVLRYRFDIHLAGAGGQLLAEQAAVVAYTGTGDNPTWLDADATSVVLEALPSANVNEFQAKEFFDVAVSSLPGLSSTLDAFADAAASQLLESHNRVRDAVKARTGATRVEPRRPVDILGVYVFLPGGN
jgi:superfamily II DNA or RNA helicase